MKKCDMAINAGLITAFIALFLNLPEDGYLKFVDLRPVAETELAKVIDGNTQDCLTTPSQTKLVPMSEALKLEGKTTRQVLDEFGNWMCQGKKGGVSYLKYATDSAKELYIRIDKSLDEPIQYGFNPPETGNTAAKAEARGGEQRVSDRLPRKTRSEGSSLEKR